MHDKKMFKVIAHIDHGNGRGSHWMRLGSAFVNKDNSINIYLDAIPVGKQDITLQLREMEEEDFKKREFTPRTGSAAPLASQASDGLPF